MTFITMHLNEASDSSREKKAYIWKYFANCNVDKANPLYDLECNLFIIPLWSPFISLISLFLLMRIPPFFMFDGHALNTVLILFAQVQLWDKLGTFFFLWEGDPPAHAYRSQPSSWPRVNLLSTLRYCQSTVLNSSPFQLLDHQKVFGI